MADIVFQIMYVITLVLTYGGALLGIFCVIDSASRRADAYVAADKLTKPAWFGINIACGVALGLGLISAYFQPPQMLWLAALVGVLVYLVDVRPNVKRVARGRW